MKKSDVEKVRKIRDKMTEFLIQAYMFDYYSTRLETDYTHIDYLYENEVIADWEKDLTYAEDAEREGMKLLKELKKSGLKISQ